jgi:predicted amidohydrolase YtcJ
MKKNFFLHACCAGLLLISMPACFYTEAPAPDTIYVKGKILTMDMANSIVEAVAVKDGKIFATGTTADITKMAGSKTTTVDLQGKTMIPGIIDGHSHIMSAMNNSKIVNLEAPPVGDVKSIADIVARLKKFKEDHKIPAGEWIIGRGYDPDQLTDKRHPLKEDLDPDFPDNPVLLVHTSGHLSVVNSAALKVSGVDASTPDPEGGQIVRKPGSKEPTGLLLEKGRSVLKMTSKPESLEQRLQALKEVQEYYASFGITTAQDGHTSYGALDLLKTAAKQNALLIDFEALASYAIIDTLLQANSGYEFNKMKNHFKIAGFKLVADGSPQGKTAFFTQPYLTDVPGCSDHCTGIPTVTPAQIDEAIEKGFKNHIQTFVHCNGDATVDMYTHAVEKARQKLGKQAGPRPVIIHSQFIRPDQLDKYKELGMVPAFFTNHAFFWGDTHFANLGPERANFLSPLHSALNKKIIFTNHTDYSVTPINQMFLLWTSVARESRSGRVMGEGEKLTPMEGLRAITINGAYQYFEENSKGSIEKGKLADFAILSDDPITIATVKIKDIQVLETIKEGKTIYKRK